MEKNLFLENTKNREANPLLLRALDLISTDEKASERRALDLGCGAGRDTRALLEHGFAVEAVDASSSAENYLPNDERVHFSNTGFENWTVAPKTYDFINSQWSHSFTKPEEFSNFWNNLVSSLKNGGIFCGNFFGNNDGWSDRNHMTFLTAESARELFNNFNIIFFEEREYLGKLAVGGTKQWHVINVIAQKK